MSIPFGVRRVGLKLLNIRCFLRRSRHPQCARRVSKHRESVQLVCARQLLHPFPCDSLTQLSGLLFKRRAGVARSETLSSCARPHPVELSLRPACDVRRRFVRKRQIPLREVLFIKLVWKESPPALVSVATGVWPHGGASVSLTTAERRFGA